MVEFVRQDYKGQTFAKAVAETMAPILLVSGYAERDPNYEGRFWWGLTEDSGGDIFIICGYVSNFRHGGWDYKIAFIDQWTQMPNPPLQVRKAIAKHHDRILKPHRNGFTRAQRLDQQ